MSDKISRRGLLGWLGIAPLVPALVPALVKAAEELPETKPELRLPPPPFFLSSVGLMCTVCTIDSRQGYPPGRERF